MLYRICDQLVILVRFRHLNGNLKLAGSGDGVDLWGVSWWHTTLDVSGRWGWFTGTCHGGARLDRGDRIDLWGRAIGTHFTGWIWAMGLNHGDMWYWLDRWNCFMGIRDTGWSGAMGLIYGGVWHWLERSDGIDSGELAMGAHHTGWIRVMDWFMGVCRGVRHATRAGSRW